MNKELVKKNLEIILIVPTRGISCISITTNL